MAGNTLSAGTTWKLGDGKKSKDPSRERRFSKQTVGEARGQEIWNQGSPSVLVAMALVIVSSERCVTL